VNYLTLHPPPPPPAPQKKENKEETTVFVKSEIENFNLNILRMKM
jgi:hypothetical protein